MKNKNLMVLGILIAASVGISGCGGYEANLAPQGQNQNLSTGDNLNMEALNKAVVDVENSSAEIDTSLSKISILSLSSDTQNSLDKSLRGIFEKLLGSAQGLEDRLKEIRAQIEAELLKLNPSNPAYQEVFQRLTHVLTQIDQIEQKLKEKLKLLTDRMRGLVESFDDKVAALDPKNPLSWVAAIAWERVRTVLMEYIDKLALLVP